MKITERKLRSIIRQVIKESSAPWSSPQEKQRHVYELCDFFRSVGYDLGTFHISGSSRTLSNVSYAWSQMSPNAHDKIFEQCKKSRPDLLPILKEVMSDADRHKTSSQTSSDGRYTTTSYRGQS